MNAYEKRKQWFISMVGKKVYRPPVKCDCESCINGHRHGVLVLDKDHALYLMSCEVELGIRYNEKKLDT